jgi:hypothetical protein
MVFSKNTKLTKNKCSFSLISYHNVNQFGTLQKSTSVKTCFLVHLQISILNINDKKDINFFYIQISKFILIPILSITIWYHFAFSLFYANMIIGVDADTFSLEGGTIRQAQNIVTIAQ